eukprot:CAMPEP_0170550728 /NCGR_PEP_ID=MMETSP0211-20121228/8730_1 /TAXON_ID=311385 /ORGANISM="Pseudokeronopsis sp., Strain OXSARD2" /LENGTH=69 /DNA_ID=CAMNT_0010857407 /DNA_START=383 /DNA_END=592 /DNA_ORIENTATION=-
MKKGKSNLENKEEVEEQKEEEGGKIEEKREEKRTVVEVIPNDDYGNLNLEDKMLGDGAKKKEAKKKVEE